MVQYRNFDRVMGARNHFKNRASWTIKMKRVNFIMLLFFFCMSNLFAQSFNLTEVDTELCKIGNEDQQIRFKLIEAMQKSSPDFENIRAEMLTIDTRNQTYVSNLLDNKGWPEKLSDCANKAKYHVINHAPHFFQEKYFALVKEKAEQGIVQKSDAVTLEDRVLMRSRKKQKCGTQTINQKTNDGVDVVYVWPVEDNEKIDELRASVGLPPMSLYLQLVENQLNRKIIWDKTLTINDFNINF